MLEKDHIRRLFFNQPIADEAIFEYNLKIYQNSLDKNSNVESNVEIENPCRCKVLPNKELFKGETFSVGDILEDTYSGKSILRYYNQHNALHEDQRTLLITSICNYLQEKEIECSVSKCSDMEKEICTIFPTEKLVSFNITSKFHIFKVI